MARKGNQSRNAVDHRHASRKEKVSGSTRKPDMKERKNASEVKNINRDEFAYDYDPSNLRGIDDETNIDQVSQRVKGNLDSRTVKDLEESMSSRYSSNSFDSRSKENPGPREENGTLPDDGNDRKHTRNEYGYLLNTFPIKLMMENVALSSNTAARNLKLLALPILNTTGEWLERHRPLFVSITSSTFKSWNYAKVKIVKAYPVVLKLLFQFGSIMLLLFLFWLNFTLRGLDSFLHLGTTAFFSVLWCSIMSVIAMIGMFKFLIVLVVAALIGVLISLSLSLLLTAAAGIVSLWYYGSFWATSFVVLAGGLAFMLSHECVALLITTVYSVYSVWTYAGWLGLLLALNLSFFSSDILIYLVKNNVTWQRSNRHPEFTPGMESQPEFFSGESSRASFPESRPNSSTNRGPGEPSTSGLDSELTSEDEVIRLLNCTDHYSALGFSRYENVDAAVLKREYRKKAMLVHPDKNNGNEKAAEAFKKLQNAYEVLLDSLKQKSYDEELRREDLLNYFRRFQNTSQKGGEHGPEFPSPDANGVGSFGNSRRIACKKCGNFHVWIYTSKQKSQARWCQDCKEHHQAKDGDGWVEQSSQPILFGLMRKFDGAIAYVCADSKIYDATEWYICQGMRCPANSHKPSFRVNTSVTSKHSTGKGSSTSQRGGRVPPSNTEETMTEEEFFEWLQNAFQAGVFDNFSGNAPDGSPSARATNGSKSGSGGSGSSSSSKRKKKGKKQW